MTAGDVEDVPAVARDVFADRLELASRFVAHLATSGVEWGLLGPRELPRLWSRHVLNCAVVAELVAPSRHVIDVGSGAGLPGIALAIARRDLRVTLVEPLERRVLWLERVVQDLELDLAVVRARAEDLHGSLSAPVVTARAVAALPQLSRWGLPLVAPGGELLAVKGRTAAAELEKSVPALRQMGAESWDVVECGARLAVPTTVVRVRVGAGESGRDRRRGRGPTGRKSDT